MTEIENPWHSRPIDVHRWSEHPEVKALVDWIWDEYLSEEVVGGPGRNPKQPFKKQLRVSRPKAVIRGGADAATRLP